MQTELYRDHHAELRDLVERMPSSASALNADDARSMLVELTKLLKVHLQMEDGFMYPRMLAHPDPAVKAKAQKFQQEMGGLSSAYTAFFTQWIAPGAIERDGRAFLYDWTTVRRALTVRMAREDDDLYALVDARVQLNA